MHDDVLCVGRCAVPATLLPHVLGLPADWLSRLPGSVQRYVSVPQQQPQESTLPHSLLTSAILGDMLLVFYLVFFPSQLLSKGN